jgi:alginate O-acetyltransferase complex protein AlgI
MAPATTTQSPASLSPEQIQQLPVEQIRAFTAEQVAELSPSQLAAAHRVLDAARWAEQPAYFRWLHELLPEPFFQTQGFLLFFLVVACCYWLIPRRFNTARVLVLVVASFHFYAAWNATLAFLVTITATLDYLFARFMDASERRGVRRFWMWSSIVMNLGVLCYFKYRGFFLNELHDLLSVVGLGSSYSKFSALDILIPFGISFYTFEAISYAVDVFQRRIKAERSLLHFLLFILFFPHLVAGPIVRAWDFLPQAHRIKRWNWVRIQVGVQFFLLGLFKKLAIADRMAIFADPVFANPEQYNSSAIWLAVLAYALRIYADFSGYSDMAVGTAHFFGYRLTQNFNMPYLATNVQEFWHRWHISLSTWLRDYLYIPLGGSRCSPIRRNFNLMITMLLGGLWHGANWSYLIWGGLHGLMLVAHRQFQGWAKQRPLLDGFLQSAPGTVLRVLTTFLFVMLCWVFFRPELTQSLTMLERMFWITTDGMTLPLHNRSLWYTVLFVLACHLLVAKGLWQWLWERTPPVAAGFGYATCLTAAMLLAPEQGQSFIYFTF